MFRFISIISVHWYCIFPAIAAEVLCLRKTTHCLEAPSHTPKMPHTVMAGLGLCIEYSIVSSNTVSG